MPSRKDRGTDSKRNKFSEVELCGFRVMPVHTDKRTDRQTDRQTYSSQYFAHLPSVWLQRTILQLSEEGVEG